VAAVPEYRRSSAYTEQDTNLFRILQTSFDLLADREKNFLSYFAIFPEDAQIPMAAIELLGPLVQLDELEIEQCVKKLDDAALLTFHRSAENPLSSYVTLHDLQRDFVVHQSKSHDHRKCHSAWANAFRDRYGNGKFYGEGPTPPYLRQFMVYHLVKAGMNSEMLDLLVDPDWISHRLLAKDRVREIIRDFDLGLADQGGTS
jgi:hypothetical protein